MLQQLLREDQHSTVVSCCLSMSQSSPHRHFDFVISSLGILFTTIVSQEENRNTLQRITREAAGPLGLTNIGHLVAFRQILGDL